MDANTYVRFNIIQDVAKRRGLDLAEALESRGLLVTVERKAKILQQLRDELAVHEPGELLARRFSPQSSWTPADMYLVILEFIDEMIELTKKGEGI